MPRQKPPKLSSAALERLARALAEVLEERLAERERLARLRKVV